MGMGMIGISRPVNWKHYSRPEILLIPSLLSWLPSKDTVMASAMLHLYVRIEPCILELFATFTLIRLGDERSLDSPTLSNKDYGFITLQIYFFFPSRMHEK